MRRAKPISVRVKAPSRGLVTRLPGELADQIPPSGGLVPVSIFLPSTMRRAAALSSNVRYEDGVVAKAPGYQTVSVSANILTDFIAQWNLDELSGTRFDSSGNAHNLTEVDGIDSLFGLTLTVGTEEGKFDNAALFPSLQYVLMESDSITVDATLGSGLSFISPRPIPVEDFMLVDSALTTSFISPRSSALHDSMLSDSALFSGAYLATIAGPVTVSDPSDDITSDSALSSGTYTETVIGPESVHYPEDDVTTDSALSSGTYTLVVVTKVDSDTADDITSDSALSSGAYTETVNGPVDDEDGLLLTVGLDSGSYG